MNIRFSLGFSFMLFFKWHVYVRDAVVWIALYQETMLFCFQNM